MTTIPQHRDVTPRPQLLTIVANAVYGSVFRQRARKLLERLRTGAGEIIARDLVASHAGGEDEVSEEVVVWGDRDEGGGGGTDVITLDPWMWEFKMEIIIPYNVPTIPDQEPGDDTPEIDPCTSLAQSLSTLRSVLAADKTSLQAFDELIAEASSPAERKALREQKRKTNESIKETEQLIKDVKDEMATLGC